MSDALRRILVKENITALSTVSLASVLAPGALVLALHSHGMPWLQTEKEAQTR